MNLYNLFEAPKRTPAPGTTGVMDNQVQSAASPIGSGTSRWESKKKPVTMMGVGNNGVVAEARDVQLDEISNAILGSYKKAASADASAADRRGDFERGDKRFRGIVKATIKQGANDAKRHKQQGVSEGSLNEFAPGEGGFGPFKVYISNEFIEEFSTFDQAKEEIEFLRTADPKSFDADWKIIDGTGKIVWQHDPGEAIDAMRMRRKIQFIKPDDKGVAEAKWNPYDQGDFPTDYNADDPAVGAGVGNAEKWQAMRSYYQSRFSIVGALQAQRGLMHPAHGTRHGVQAIMSTSLGKRVVKTFPNKEKAYDYADVHGYEVVEIKDTGLATNPITLNVVLGHGEHKKQFSLQFPDMEKAQEWADRYHAEILGQSVAEGTGQDSKSWMASIQQQYPTVQFVQAKMMGAPIMAMVNGKPVAQFDTKKGVTEAIPLDTLRSTAGTRVKDEVSTKLKQNGPLGRDTEKAKDDNNSTHGMDRYVKPVRPGEINKALQKGIDQRNAARERMQANVANLPTYTRDGVAESMGRATPKMPKPRDPGHAVLAAKRSSGAAGQHTNKKRQALLQPKHQKPLTRDMDMNEDIERHLMQMRHAGYDI